MPLGDAWSGVCRAAPDREWLPDANTLQQLCNFGYAREKCARVPADTPDAVRIYWVMEKDHLPFAHGPLEYSRAEADFWTAHPDACITQQALAYLGSYLHRKGDSVQP